MKFSVICDPQMNRRNDKNQPVVRRTEQPAPVLGFPRHPSRCGSTPGLHCSMFYVLQLYRIYGSCAGNNSALIKEVISKRITFCSMDRTWSVWIFCNFFQKSVQVVRRVCISDNKKWEPCTVNHLSKDALSTESNMPTSYALNSQKCNLAEQTNFV